MLFPKSLIWQLVSKRYPEDIARNKEVKAVASTLFPGMNHGHVSGLIILVQKHVTPVLLKIYPELEGSCGITIHSSDKLEVSKFMSSEDLDGFEWQHSEQWQKKFKEKLNTC